MPQDNSIDRMLQSHAEGLSYIQAQSANMELIYAAARSKIMDMIIGHAGKHNAPYSGKYLVQLSEQLQKEYAAFEANIRDSLKVAIPYMAQSYYLMALNALGLGGNIDVLGNIDKERIKYMVESAFNDVAGATKQMRDVEIRHLRNISAKVFRETALTGETRGAVSRKLLNEAISLPGFRFIDKAGRKWDTKSYFDMLGRTVLMNAGRSGYLDACAANGSDIVRVTVSAHPCPRCAVFENRLLSISGKTPGLPTVDYAIGRGLFHPNCTHSLVAVPPAMVEKYYNSIGRANAGVNSPGNEAADNPEAWKKYRSEHTFKGDWTREAMMKVDKDLERSVMKNTLPALNPEAPNVISGVELNKYMPDKTTGCFIPGSNLMQINQITAKRTNNFLNKYRAGSMDDINLEDLRGMKTLCHEINHSRQHPYAFGRGTAGRNAIELINEEYTLANFNTVINNLGFNVKPEWQQLLTEKGYAYQNIVKNSRDFAKAINALPDYQREVEALAFMNGTDKPKMLKAFFNGKLQKMGYNNSIGLDDIFNGDWPLWLKQNKI